MVKKTADYERLETMSICDSCKEYYRGFLMEGFVLSKVKRPLCSKKECHPFEKRCEAIKKSNVFIKFFNVPPPVERGYGDFSAVTDLHTAISLSQEAKESFDELPAEVRAYFFENPYEFLKFVDNPKTTRDDLIRVGLLQKVASEAEVK